MGHVIIKWLIENQFKTVVRLSGAVAVSRLLNNRIGFMTPKVGL